MNLRNLNIGSLLKISVSKNQIDISRICNFLNCTEKEVLEMYSSPSLDTEILLRWSKLLEYDFFRLYSQHLILYAPQSSMQYVQKKKADNSLPAFRKNLYTKEIVE
ncbi:transposase, partial [Chryseobacterium sp. IT-36CA2]|uniref:transposase n=1 Tax=Chryseobacterium sp. IT-36CA2 TaxID=3026460 RepID=UPI0039E1A8DE